VRLVTRRKTTGLVLSVALALTMESSRAWAADEPAPASAPAAAVETPPESPKSAEPAPDASKAWETAPHEHRGGFVVGLTALGGVGASNGFPSDAKKIGRLAHYTESGLGFAGAGGLWIGGALADWLNFGVGGSFSTILNGATRSPSPIILFHSDVYPLYPLGGQWRNLGVIAEFGLGFPSTIDLETEETLIDGGGSSYVLGGVFWEGIEAWKLKMGPMLAAHYMFSDSIRRPAAVLGFRMTLYSAP